MKKILPPLLLIFFGFSFTLKAQNWASGIDDDRFNWGYAFQYIAAEYKIIKTPDWQAPFYDALGNHVTDSLKSLSSKVKPGFAIGFVANRKLNKFLDLRFTPTLVFSDREVNYSYGGSMAMSINRQVRATMIDLPLSIKLKSERLMNFRAYMLGGLKYSVGITSSKKQNNTDRAELDKYLNSKKSFLSYEAGAGMDFYFPYFKMSTEIKISHSIKDILLHEPTAFATPIDKAILRHFTFSLFFE